MKSFHEWLLSEDNLSKKYDRKAFVSLPWDWGGVIKAKVIQPLFYYARDSYVDGKPEVIGDDSATIVTIPNLRSIPKNELSARNIHTGNPPDMNSFMSFLRNPEAWYDDKIDQVYDGIKMIGKRPEDFGGVDIRPTSPQIS